LSPQESSAALAWIYSLLMSATPPGWYRDPGGSTNWRWWDGTRWTEHLMAAGVAGPRGDWGTSIRSAENAEARLSAWAVAAVLVYVGTQTANTIAATASLPAVVQYMRQVLDNFGATPPQEPAAFHATSLLVFPGIVAGVVFLVWQFRAAKTARALGYPARRSPALGAWSWVIPVVNLWFPYQAMRDLLPPGHAVRSLVLRTWLCYVLTLVAIIVSYQTAFSSSGAGQAIGCIAILGWIVVGTGAYRVAKAVAADHAAAVGRY
jgi:hypothetical protein